MVENTEGVHSSIKWCKYFNTRKKKNQLWQRKRWTVWLDIPFFTRCFKYPFFVDQCIVPYEYIYLYISAMMATFKHPALVDLVGVGNVSKGIALLMVSCGIGQIIASPFAGVLFFMYIKISYPKIYLIHDKVMLIPHAWIYTDTICTCVQFV